MTDYLLTGGTVIDGSGAPGRRQNVLIQEGRISRIAGGEIPAPENVHTIDVTGRVVAPGFVDVHNHSDGWLLRERVLVPKVAQGFTTEVLMSDGIGYAPLTPELAADWMIYLRPLGALEPTEYTGWESIADYLERLDRKTAQNTIAQIPYANVRVLACGWGRAPPDDTQVNLIRNEIRRGLDQGAVGVSTGLDYIAQCFATTDEIVRGCEPLAEAQGLYVSHVRYKEGTVRGVREAVDIARRLGVGLHISHLKGLSPRESDELLAYLDSQAVHEVDLSFDVYPYMPGSTLLSSRLPYEAWEEGPLAVCARLRDPDLRRRFAATMDHKAGAGEVTLAWLRSRRGSRWHGRRLADYAAAHQQSVAEAAVSLLIEEQLAVLGVFHIGDDALVEPFLTHKRSMIASDGIYFPDGVVHPRVYGTAPRVLGPLVRDRKLFTLEDAVRRLSGFPAERFGLADRGILREGAWADVVVFDPRSITDRATYEEPHQLPVGIDYVLVNGVMVLAEGEIVDREGPSPGRALAYRR